MNRNHTRLLSLILVLVIGICAQGIVAAQQPGPTPEPGAVPDAPTLEPGAQATARAPEDEWMREFESRSPFDFYIAYLIAPDAPLGSELMSEQSFIDTFGAQVFHSWDAFAEQNELNPFQIVMLHDSLFDQIDTSWTQWAYRNRILLVGIGMPFEHVTDLTGDHCLKNPNPFYMTDRFNIHVLIFSYAVMLGDESLREYVDQTQLVDCNDDYEVGDVETQIYKGVTNFPLDRPEWLVAFADTLVETTIYYQLNGTRLMRVE